MKYEKKKAIVVSFLITQERKKSTWLLFFLKRTSKLHKRVGKFLKKDKLAEKF